MSLPTERVRRHNIINNILDIKRLKKYFSVPGGKLHAVDNVSFSILKGKTLGIVGESGCGKSTLGRTILRLHEPTSGQIFFDGIDILTLTSDEMIKMRKNMQIIFQDPYASLNPRFMVSKIIEEPLKLHKLFNNKVERRRKVEELMELVGLQSRVMNSYPHEFDGGRRQRIVIARALAISPQFVVCDEPVSALDVSVQAQIINLLMELQEKLSLTYIFISHDLSVVKHISDQVGVMYLGQLIELAPKKELFSNPMHPYTQALLAAIPTMNFSNKKQRTLLSGEIISPINPSKGCRFGSRCPYCFENCRQRDPEMKEIKPGHLVACHLI